MTEQNQIAHPSKGPSKRKAQSQDDSIMGTNNSSIVSKRSVERVYFPDEPHYFRYFVKKPQRRSPLINRGYWLRMRAIDQVVRRFLEQTTEKQKIVINLGCGFDPLPWQCLTRYPTACTNVKFIDIDYKDLMIRKRNVVKVTEELNSMLTNMEILGEEDILLCSDQYLQLGCDLRDPERLSQTLASVVDVNKCLLLLIAEVSITYMDVDRADDLIKWASSFTEGKNDPNRHLLPDGISHPFAQTMIAHFDKLQTPLGAVHKYPSTSAQERRFKRLGWGKVSARNLWALWNDSDFMTPAERISLDAIEPFDEWEELALFGCHYFLLVADNEVTLSHSETQIETPHCSISTLQSQSFYTALDTEVTYSENPKAQGCRRFAAALTLRSPKRAGARVGNFAGMGLNTRTRTYDVYTTEGSGDLSFDSDATSTGPSSRMCHTITDIGDAGALLVGGRLSPENALADCWLYHKWLNTWERVDDLPIPQYRHGAVSLGHGYVLVSPGRSNSRIIDDKFYVWSRDLGWTKCVQGPGEKPCPTYGATFASFESLSDIASPRHGFLAGGMSYDAILRQEVWEWELQNFSSQQPIIVFKRSAGGSDSSCIYQPPSTIARFGANTANHQGHTWVIGGIIKDEILSKSMEVCFFDAQEKALRFATCRFPNLAPRGLLIGSSVISTGDLLLIMGGSAVCFSFGTFWNKGCSTLRVLDAVQDRIQRSAERPARQWRYLHTVAPLTPLALPIEISPRDPAGHILSSIPRMVIGSPADFDQIIRSAKPVILEGLDLGQCTDIWTTNYLKDRVGANREVVVHEATEEHMSFQPKNFAYVTKLFGEFIDHVDSGGKLYLRSLSSEKPAELPADIARDFPSIAGDFRVPPELALNMENTHSSPLRISGPVIMWLHYDVMANVLCQIRGSKRLLLFPPADVKHFEFEPGASSSNINVFEKLQSPSLAQVHPHEALLQPGDVLFIPPLWLHTALPTSGMSIAVNIFFRNLRAGYAAGKDVYGNRDLQAYEKGRQDISKIIKSFGSFPNDFRLFYLQRLAREFEQKAC